MEQHEVAEGRQPVTDAVPYSAAQNFPASL